MDITRKNIMYTNFVIKGKQVDNYSKIYFASNEKLDKIFSNVDIKDKNVLTVLGSGDQAFHLYNRGARHVDVFDKNKLTLFYYYLRRWVIQYLNAFYPETNLRNIYIKKLLKKVEPRTIEELDAYNYWSEETPEVCKPWRNYYATVFENSVSSALYSLSNYEDFYNKTVQFKNALHNSTLPSAIIDAASSNLSVLKSPTVLRLEDGSFYGWEGVGEESGSCEGTCQHVWNYAYAMCFLFPDLERSIRDVEFKYSTDTDGRMGFRIMLPLGRKMNDFRACVDGQMGAVIKCYREWKISGDNQWLKEKWGDIKKVLEYAWSDKNPDGWDLNKDGVLEGRQHHTLDNELFGRSSWLEGMYLAALKAASEMAEFLGDFDKAKEYSSLFEKGYNWTKDSLFN